MRAAPRLRDPAPHARERADPSLLVRREDSWRKYTKFYHLSINISEEKLKLYYKLCLWLEGGCPVGGAEATGAVIAGDTGTKVGISAIATPLGLHAETTHTTNADDPEAWFNKIKGKHRVIFDVTQPRGVMPFAWPKVFLLTNAATGTPSCSAGSTARLATPSPPTRLSEHEPGTPCAPRRGSSRGSGPRR